MASALYLYDDKRIHSACSVICKGKKLSDPEIAEIYPDGLYNGMPIVHELPPGVKTGEKEISDYLYIDEKYVYDPLPKPEPEEPPTEESVWDELDSAYQEGVDSV